MEESQANNKRSITKEAFAMDRRRFLKNSGLLLLSGSVMSGLPFSALAANEDIKRLSILHTNDVHSRIEPFPMDGSRNQGLGGAARRAALIRKIREEQEHVLLLDAGDMVQGTPYFNLFGGKLELELMNKMGYDAGTFGNHEFDNGLDRLADMISHANFPFLTSNYDFSDTPLAGKTRDYQLFRKGRMKIGVFGLGIELEGLVDPLLCAGVRYLDPIAVANNMAARLRYDHQCDLVICLSHLGYRYQDDQVSDRVLAMQTRDIDLIIGGHTHTFLSEPEQIRNLAGELTIVNQVGFAGINLGRIDFLLERRSGKKRMVAAVYKVSDRVPDLILHA